MKQENSDKESRSEYDRLLCLIKEGDLEALKELYEKTFRAVYGYCLSICQSPPDAEEAAQDVFLAVWDHADRYEAGGNPMAWLFTIARNLCYMRLRRRRSRPEGSLEEMQEQEGTWEPGQDCREVEMAPERQDLLAALSLLTPDDRQLVLLHAVGGMKHREIAEHLGLPLSTVLSRYRRALKKLEKELR